MKKNSNSLLISIIVIMLISFAAHLTISTTALNEHREVEHKNHLQVVHPCFEPLETPKNTDKQLEAQQCGPTLMSENEPADHKVVSSFSDFLWIVFAAAIGAIILGVVTFFIHRSKLYEKMKGALSRSFKWDDLVVGTVTLANFILCLVLYEFFNNHDVPLVIKSYTHTLFWFVYLIFVGAATVCYLLINSGIYSALFPDYSPDFVVANNSKKVKDHRVKEEMHKGLLPKYILNFEKKWAAFFIYILGSLLVLITMHADVHSLTNIEMLATSYSAKSASLTVIEVLLNFWPSVFILITVYAISIRAVDFGNIKSNRLFGKSLTGSVIVYAALMLGAGLFYFILLLIKVFLTGDYANEDAAELLANKILYFISISIGTLLLTLLDSQIRSKEWIRTTIKAGALPVGALGSFKFYLARMLENHIEVALKDLIAHSNNPVKQNLLKSLQLQVNVAEDLLSKLNKQSSSDYSEVLNKARAELRVFLNEAHINVEVVNQIESDDVKIEYINAIYLNHRLKEIAEDLLKTLN